MATEEQVQNWMALRIERLECLDSWMRWKREISSSTRKLSDDANELNSWLTDTGVGVSDRDTWLGLGGTKTGIAYRDIEEQLAKLQGNWNYP